MTLVLVHVLPPLSAQDGTTANMHVYVSKYLAGTMCSKQVMALWIFCLQCSK